LENSTSHTERYIIIPNSVTRKIGDLGGVNLFRLYVGLHLQKNWQNEVFTTPNLLLKLLGRKEQYWPKQLRTQLLTLTEKKFITIDKEIEGLGVNNHFKIKISLLSGPATEIKCVNEEIFNLQTLVNANTLFATFAFVKMCIDKEVGFARVAKETIAKGLGLSEKTVEKTIKILEDNGFLSITRGIYIPANSKKECNKYRAHDYGSLMWKFKRGLASLPEKKILKEVGETESEIDKKISEVLADPAKFSPCVFKGLPAKLFREYYDTLEYGCIFTICSISDMPEVMEGYDGILSVPGGMIILYFEKLTDGIEGDIVTFLKGSVLPVFLLLGEGVEITNNNLKSEVRYEFS